MDREPGKSIFIECAEKNCHIFLAERDRRIRELTDKLHTYEARLYGEADILAEDGWNLDAFFESTSSNSNLSNEDMISLITLSQPEVDTPKLQTRYTRRF